MDRFRQTPTILTLLVLGGCTADLTCGVGTKLEDGACVSDGSTITNTNTNTNTVTTGLECGEGTEEVNGECVAISTGLDCGEGTVEVDGECVPSALEPGHYESPMVELRRSQGDEDHMHIQEARYRESDAKLFICSYTLVVLDATEPQDPDWLVQGVTAVTPSDSDRDPGCHRLDWSDDDPNIWFTTHRKNASFATYLSAWDLQMDPKDPASVDMVQIEPALQEEGVSYEGIDYANGHLFGAIHEGGIAVWDFDGATFTRIGENTEFDNAWDIVVHESGSFAVVADGLAGLVTVDVSDPTSPQVLGRVSTGGAAEVLVLNGDIAYVASGAAGLVIVDVGDPSSPVVLSTTSTPGTAVGIDYSDNKVFLAAWNDTRVYDVTDPTAPAMIGGTWQTVEQTYDTDEGLRPDITARTLGVAGYGNFVFIGNWWVPFIYEVHPEYVAPYIVLPETFSNVGFGPVEVGATGTTTFEFSNDGTAPLTAYDIWTSNSSFTVSPTQVVVNPGESAVLTLTYTATIAEEETASLYIYSDDPQEPVREAWLVGNQPGLGVGVPMPETTGTLVDGNSWSYMESGFGAVTVLAYFATF